MSDKLLRLKSELTSAFDLARNVRVRESQKRENYADARSVWEKRMALVDLKRKFPSLGPREDEELLYDKERLLKRPRPSDARYVFCFHSLSGLKRIIVQFIANFTYQESWKRRYIRFSITLRACSTSEGPLGCHPESH